jgi:hypothetical protein
MTISFLWQGLNKEFCRLGHNACVSLNVNRRFRGTCRFLIQGLRKATCSPETLIDFLRTTLRYIPKCIVELFIYTAVITCKGLIAPCAIARFNYSLLVIHYRLVNMFRALLCNWRPSVSSVFPLTILRIGDKGPEILVFCPCFISIIVLFHERCFSPARPPILVWILWEIMYTHWTFSKSQRYIYSCS